MTRSSRRGAVLPAVRRAWTRATARTRGEQGFAIVLSLLMIMMMGALAIGMGAVVIEQAKPTQEARKQVQTVNAAASGLQVALTNLRAADGAPLVGDLTKLPCTSATAASFDQGSGAKEAPGASFSGTVANGSARPTYRVSVAYYRSNPAGKDAAWLAAEDNVMACPLTEVPYYAYLQGYGAGAQIPGNTAAQGSRSQTAVYEFLRTNINVAGGRIREFGTTVCLDAGPGPWLAGQTMTVEICQARGTAQQTWQYRNDLTLFFGGDVSLNLCIEADAGAPTPRLEPCVTGGTGSTYPYVPGQQSQEWGFNDVGHFSAALDAGTVTNSGGGHCLQPFGGNDSTPAAEGAPLVWVTCDGGTTGYTAWNPDPQVGAGKAGGNVTGFPGAPTNQLVNYREFGRCLDITGANVSANWLIDYPCKQAPKPSEVKFNQVWTYAEVSGGYGTISVNNGTLHCLEVPLAGGLPRVRPCVSPAPSYQLWRPTGVIPGNYADSYRIINQNTGLCLSSSNTAYDFGSTKISAEACNDSSAQKWNAPPVQPRTGLNDYKETKGG